MPPKVSIMIVGYNSAELIAKCLASIPEACARHSYEILLVDQGDGSTQALVADQFDDVIIVPSRGNIGFAGGNNLLAGYAKAQFLLLLNPDVELISGAIDALLDASENHSDASAWGGVTLDRSGNPDVGNTVHVPSLREMASRLGGRSIAAIQADASFAEDEAVGVLSGGFVMIKRHAWDEAGGLDARYFLYCEEVDLFYRLGKTGHTFWRVAKARAYHDIGHGDVISPVRTLYRAAGIMQFARLHWSKPRELMAFVLMWLSASQRYWAGAIIGMFSPKFKRIAQANESVALQPGKWRFGYDQKKGLLVKLGLREPL